MVCGFVLQGIEKSKTSPRKNVFLFKDSAELIEKIKLLNK